MRLRELREQLQNADVALGEVENGGGDGCGVVYEGAGGGEREEGRVGG